MRVSLLRVMAEMATLLRLDRHGCLAPTARLDADLGLDNLDRQTLACNLDEIFLIEIPDDDVAMWETVADVCRTVDRLAAAANPIRRVAQPDYARLGLGSAAEAEGRN